jgi:hypothetical protein
MTAEPLLGLAFLSTENKLVHKLNIKNTKTITDM